MSQWQRATARDAVPEFGPRAPQSPSSARVRLPPFCACEFARPSPAIERSWKSFCSGGTRSGWRGLAPSRHPLDHTMLVAERDGRLVGALIYVVRDADCEVLTLHADDRRKGLGIALIAEVKKIARRAGCTRLWLITTNDNLDALRFYQRRGFRLAALHQGAVDDSRSRL